MKAQYIFLFVIIIASMISCKKEAGEGGNYSIIGKIIVRDYNSNFTTLNAEYNGADEDVYIIYGNEISYGNKIKTNYDGIYEFKYLRKGAYKIYTYSKDSSMKSKSGTIPLITNVVINGKNKNADVPDVIIFK